jgi:hypothetical protein
MRQLKKAITLVVFAALPGLSLEAFPQGNAIPRGTERHSIHDSNGDGICDICSQPVGSGRVNAQGQNAGKGKHFGPGDGTGNMGSGPKDGTGYGAQSGRRQGSLNGTCTGVGGQAAGAGGGMGRGRRGGRS